MNTHLTSRAIEDRVGAARFDHCDGRAGSAVGGPCRAAVPRLVACSAVSVEGKMEMQQAQMEQQQAAASARRSAGFNRAVGACLQGRGYTVD